jgi:hypothetical protein
MKSFISLFVLFFIMSCSDNSNSSDENDAVINENDSAEVVETKPEDKPENTEEEEDEITFESWLAEIPEAPHLDSIMDSEYKSDIMYYTKLQMAMPSGYLTKFITDDTIYVYGFGLHNTSNCDADLMQLFSPEGVLYDEYITEKRCADNYQSEY